MKIISTFLTVCGLASGAVAASSEPSTGVNRECWRDTYLSRHGDSPDHQGD